MNESMMHMVARQYGMNSLQKKPLKNREYSPFQTANNVYNAGQGVNKGTMFNKPFKPAGSASSIPVLSRAVSSQPIHFFGATVNAQTISDSTENLEKKEYIILFDDSVLDTDARSNILNQLDINMVEEVPMSNAALVAADAVQIEALKSIPGVRGVITNKAIPYRQSVDPSVFGIIPQPPTPEVIPWSVKQINANQVWDPNGDGKIDSNALSTEKNVKVALWDSGADINHPDLKNNVHKVYNATVVGKKNDVTDHAGHGTGMGGIMAALQNDQGIIGVSPEIKLSIVKIGESAEYNPELIGAGRGLVTPMAIQRAFDWSIKNKMQVIEISIGWFGPNLVDYFGSEEEAQLFTEMFQRGLDRCYDAGIVCVAPALNTYYDLTGVPTDPGGPEGEPRDGVRIPQNLNHIILASATADEQNNLTIYSCYANENVENKNYVCAPGNNITTLVPPELIEAVFGEPNIYYVTIVRGGTSTACAATAAVCALIVGSGIRGTGREIVDNVWKVLSTTATKIGNGYNAEGRSHQYGYGLVNAKAAVDKALSGQY